MGSIENNLNACLTTALQAVAEEHFNHDVPDDAESAVYELLREAARTLQRHNEALEDIRTSGNNEDRTVQWMQKMAAWAMKPASGWTKPIR